jgi:Tfp pilus assembly protein PilV
MSGTVLNRWLVVLVALVVLAVGALVWALTDTRDVAATDVSSADAAAAVVVSSAVKDAVRTRASTGAAAAYGYSWRTLADDKDAARRLMTPTMQQRYDRTMAGVTTSSRRDRAVVEAEVVDAALVTASATYARVLVFVNQRTSGRGLERPTLDLDRVLVTLRRVGGDWKVDELDAL